MRRDPRWGSGRGQVPPTCPAGTDRQRWFPCPPAGGDTPVLPPQNGELIYGCKDARSPTADWSELAHHLKPFFFPSNGLAAGPHCTRAVIRELVRVVTRVLLSGSDKGRAGTLRLGPGPRGPCVCEASPFRGGLRPQGRLGERAEPGGGKEICVGPDRAPQSPHPTSQPVRPPSGFGRGSTRVGCWVLTHVLCWLLRHSLLPTRQPHSAGPSGGGFQAGPDACVTFLSHLCHACAWAPQTGLSPRRRGDPWASGCPGGWFRSSSWVLPRLGPPSGAGSCTVHSGLWPVEPRPG